MEALLAERPLLLSIIIGGIAAMLAYAWLQSGNKRLGAAAALTAVLIPGIWFLADQWETDREKIQSLIDSTVRAVQANDHQTAVQVIADKSTRDQALTELPRYVFDRVAASNVVISIDEKSAPKVADVELLAKVIASDKAGRVTGMRIVRRVILTFEKTGDTWVVVDYNHMQPGGQPDAFSPANVVGNRSSDRSN